MRARTPEQLENLPLRALRGARACGIAKHAAAHPAGMFGMKRYTGRRGVLLHLLGGRGREDRDHHLRSPAHLLGDLLELARLWQRTSMSARSATSALEPTASPPVSRASATAFSSTTSDTTTGTPSPRASAEAILPAPIRPILIGAED